jgi:hypothetical protein
MDAAQPLPTGTESLSDYCIHSVVPEFCMTQDHDNGVLCDGNENILTKQCEQYCHATTAEINVMRPCHCLIACRTTMGGRGALAAASVARRVARCTSVSTSTR